MKTFLENLEMLSLAAGTSGDEAAIEKLIYDEVIGCPDCVAKTDNAGNLIVTKKGKKEPKNRLMFSAHMDEVGFIIVGATEDGLLRFRCVGGIDPRVIVSKRVLVGEDLIPGVIGAMAIHLQSPADRQRVLDYDGLYIDIGAKDKADAEAMGVEIGDAIVWGTQ